MIYDAAVRGLPPSKASGGSRSKKRNRLAREESERGIAQLKERDRQREANEAREAIAREVAERNRRAGWG
jgi:hypothetical protein